MTLRHLEDDEEISSQKGYISTLTSTFSWIGVIISDTNHLYRKIVGVICPILISRRGIEEPEFAIIPGIICKSIFQTKWRLMSIVLKSPNNYRVLIRF